MKKIINKILDIRDTYVYLRLAENNFEMIKKICKKVNKLELRDEREEKEIKKRMMFDSDCDEYTVRDVFSSLVYDGIIRLHTTKKYKYLISIDVTRDVLLKALSLYDVNILQEH